MPMSQSRRTMLRLAMLSAVGAATPHSVLQAADRRKLGQVGKDTARVKLRDGNILELRRKGRDWYAVKTNPEGRRLKSLPSGSLRLDNGQMFKFDPEGRLIGGKGSVEDFSLVFALVSDK